MVNITKENFSDKLYGNIAPAVCLHEQRFVLWILIGALILYELLRYISKVNAIG